MAKPHYRLQVLLNMKEKAEEQAKEAVAAAQKALFDKQRKLDEMHQELAGMVEHRKSKRADYDMQIARGQLKPQQMPQVDQFIKRLKENEAAFQETIRTQQQAVAEAQQRLEAEKEKLIVAARDKKAMEKHKEGFMKKALKEIADKEADAQDEIGQTIFMSRRNE